MKNLIKEITERDVTEKFAPLPKVFGRETRTYFVVKNIEDYINITKNVIKKFGDNYDIYYMTKGQAYGIFVVEKC